MSSTAASSMTGTCEACSGIVSLAAKACPHCGHPRPAQHQDRVERKSRRVWVFLGAGLAGVLVFFSAQLRDLGSGLPRCDSRAARAEVDRVMADAPIGRVFAIKIVEYSATETLASSSTEVRCRARALLSNAERTTVTYSFTVRNDRVWVEARLAEF